MPVDLKQIESVFLEAVAAPDAAARLAILNERAGSDPELRKKVEELLLAHDKPGSFLSEPAVIGLNTSVLLDDAALDFSREARVTTVFRRHNRGRSLPLTGNDWRRGHGQRLDGLAARARPPPRRS